MCYSLCSFEVSLFPRKDRVGTATEFAVGYWKATPWVGAAAPKLRLTRGFLAPKALFTVIH